jgi:hypothetical protein
VVSATNAAWSSSLPFVSSSRYASRDGARVSSILSRIGCGKLVCEKISLMENIDRFGPLGWPPYLALRGAQESI